MPRVVYFEFTADEPERAATFYENVFGWKMMKWEGPEDYWLVNTGEDSEPGINGGMLRRREGSPNATTSIEVESLDDYTESVLLNGGTQVVPRTDVPGVGSYAYFKDTEGNIFCIMQPSSPTD
ncbi:MAG: VOC family protein [Candidatus Kapaibacterium sp.]